MSKLPTTDFRGSEHSWLFGWGSCFNVDVGFFNIYVLITEQLFEEPFLTIVGFLSHHDSSPSTWRFVSYKSCSSISFQSIQCISPMKTVHTMETVICLEFQLECCNLTDVSLQSLNPKFCLLVTVVAFTLFSVDH
jgi:hypothetical protein